MNILYLLIPIGLLILGAAVWLFIWAVRSGQYEDMEGPAYRILMDDDDPVIGQSAEVAEETNEQPPSTPQ